MKRSSGTSLFARRHHRKGNSQPTGRGSSLIRAKLHTESLEQRLLLTWQPLGPGPILDSGNVVGINDGPATGAVNVIAPIPGSKEALIGTVNGGVWYAPDITVTSPAWQPLTDNMPSTSITSVEYDSSNLSRVLVGIGRDSSFGLEGGPLTGVLYSYSGSVRRLITANPSGGTFMATAHGLTNGTQVRLGSSGTLPTGFSETSGYFVVGVQASTPNTFQLSASLGGPPIPIVDAGSGTHSVIEIVPSEHQRWTNLPPGPLANRSVSDVALLGQGTIRLASVNDRTTQAELPLTLQRSLQGTIPPSPICGNGLFRQMVDSAETSEDQNQPFNAVPDPAFPAVPFFAGTNVKDLEFDPINNILYAVGVSGFACGGRSGVFWSNDNGQTWNPVPVGLAPLGINVATTVDVRLDVASNGDLLVAVVNQVAAPRTDQLTTITRITAPSGAAAAVNIPIPPQIHPGGQGQIHFSFRADPTNPNVIYLGGDRQQSAFSEYQVGGGVLPAGSEGLTWTDDWDPPNIPANSQLVSGQLPLIAISDRFISAQMIGEEVFREITQPPSSNPQNGDPISLPLNAIQQVRIANPAAIPEGLQATVQLRWSNVATRQINAVISLTNTSTGNIDPPRLPLTVIAESNLPNSVGAMEPSGRLFRGELINGNWVWNSLTHDGAFSAADPPTLTAVTAVGTLGSTGVPLLTAPGHNLAQGDMIRLVGTGACRDVSELWFVAGAAPNTFTIQTASNAAVPVPLCTVDASNTLQFALYKPVGRNHVGSAPHPDSRDLAIVGVGSNTLLVDANDGGIYSRRLGNYALPTEILASWRSANGTPGQAPLQVGEIITADWNNQNDRVVAGTIDNGTVQSPGRLSLNNRWQTQLDGDGTLAEVFDASTPAVTYFSREQLQNLTRNNQPVRLEVQNVPMPPALGGTLVVPFHDFECLTCPIVRPIFPNVPFVVPFATNSVDRNRIAIGTEYLYESTDQGETLQVVNGINRTAPGTYVPAMPFGNDATGVFPAQITALAYGGMQNGQASPEVLYVGTENGDVYVRRAGAPTGAMPALTNRLAGGQVKDIVLDPNNWEIAYAITNSNVFWTNDGGTNWNNMTNIGVPSGGDLPTVMREDLQSASSLIGDAVAAQIAIGGTFEALALAQIDGDVGVRTNQLYVAGTNGVFYIPIEQDSASAPGRIGGPDRDTWVSARNKDRTNSNLLPRAGVHDLRFDSQDQILVASSLGRGVWTLDLGAENRGWKRKSEVSVEVWTNG